MLQRTEVECAEAIETAAECRVGDQPLLHAYKEVWMLSPAAFEIVDNPATRSALQQRGVLPYRRPADPLIPVRQWLEVHSRITTGDHSTMTGLTGTGALRQLERLAADGRLTRGDEVGRNAHFTAGPRWGDD